MTALVSKPYLPLNIFYHFNNTCFFNHGLYVKSNSCTDLVLLELTELISCLFIVHSTISNARCITSGNKSDFISNYTTSKEFSFRDKRLL